MTPEALTQRSPEWYQFKCGKISASRIWHLMATTQTKKPTADRAKLFKHLLSERLTGKPIIKRVPSLDARADMEEDAIIAYEYKTDADVQKVGCVLHPTIPNALASPDGLVGPCGVLEIKCLDTAQHVDVLETGIIANEYLYQMQFQMACTGRLWADFVAYDPRLPEEMKLIVKRVERDDHLIKKIEQAVIEFDAEIEAKIAALRSGNGLQASA
jgi:putative phage-type endonuclease